MRKLGDIDTNVDTRKNAGQRRGKVGESRKHDSADKHVCGSAVYIDDRPNTVGQLHAAIGKSTIAHGKILSLDLSEVERAAGVVAVITADDIPGHVDVGPVFPGDLLFASETVEFNGQALFAVAASSHELACKAATLAKIEYQELPPILSVEQAHEAKSYVRPSHTQKRGDSSNAIANAAHRLKGSLSIGGQEHFYLEGQVSTAEPTEDGGMIIYSSSQHPTEVQKLVAEVLSIPFNLVTVDIRRMGGGFGGKETQAAPWACVAALLAHHTQKPVKLRLGRADDMLLTGKRHPFETNYDVGFDQEGLINGIEIEVSGTCGISPDLSDAIVDRAMFHADNAYYLDQATITGHRCKTNTVSNTAFRGFGGPQGMLVIEGAMDDIARYLNKDPLEVRKLNLYQKQQRNITHYHQTVEHNNLLEIIEKLELSSDYAKRRRQISEFNKYNPIVKKGIALTPVKFGISFTVQHLNQAGALVHIYTDGSIHLNHGGTEMGQGLFVKVAQIVAQEFSVDVRTVNVSSTRTDKVPNTSPTAASSGTDINGKAAQNAAQIIKTRLLNFASEHFKVDVASIEFLDGQVSVGEQTLSFAELVQLAYMNRVSLSSTGFYKTPKIHYDRETASGRPFFYFANGAAVSEVMIDTLTGEYKVSRVDILHDVGTSLNPDIDLGQIEGGFIQGMGWLTTEELCWDNTGRMQTTGPATYKIPAVSDTPEIFNVALLADEPNREPTIYHSKAVGEPPLMLAISVWSALRDAVASISDYTISPKLNTPATPERVLNAVSQIKLSIENGKPEGRRLRETL